MLRRRSSSRTDVSSVISCSATSRTLLKQYLMPAAGNEYGSVRSLPRPNTASGRRRALELQADGHEVVRRPRAGVLERELALELLADVVDLRVEVVGLVPAHEERRVHDHLVADDLVRPRRDRRVSQVVVDLPDVGVRLVGERLLDEPAELHPG